MKYVQNAAMTPSSTPEQRHTSTLSTLTTVGTLVVNAFFQFLHFSAYVASTSASRGTPTPTQSTAPGRRRTGSLRCSARRGGRVLCERTEDGLTSGSFHLEADPEVSCGLYLGPQQTLRNSPYQTNIA
uniref:Uncharacterized protein n=1 Tax=Knipowitschia caucasica TaxID=637954 RepID=A0AAV2IYY0_KNICA